MRTPYFIALLLMSMAGPTMAQSGRFESQATHLLNPGGRGGYFDGVSHIEVDLGQKNALVVGFNKFADVEARKNVDSVLRLFVANYRRVIDTTQGQSTTTHALFRLGQTNQTLDIRYVPQPTTSFRFTGDRAAPTLVKTRQDTLQIVWSSAVSALPRYDFSLYLLVNNLNDVEGLLKNGELNSRLQEALTAVREYKNHDLTNPRLSFDLFCRRKEKKVETFFFAPGLVKSPYISLHLLGIGVGLIRNQWVPSINPSLEFIPNRRGIVGYSVGYLSNFFFNNGSDGRARAQRNDFLTVGLSLYKRNEAADKKYLTTFRAGFSIGFSTYRSGDYFERNTMRLCGEIALSNLVRVQPEIYMNGFFKQVFPGVRISFGL